MEIFLLFYLFFFILFLFNFLLHLVGRMLAASAVRF